MGTVTTLPRSRPLTRADLDAMPDDGHRYELIDGALIVTPAPSVGHQFSVGRLHLLLAAACPPGHGGALRAARRRPCGGHGDALAARRTGPSTPTCPSLWGGS